MKKKAIITNIALLVIIINLSTLVSSQGAFDSACGEVSVNPSLVLVNNPGETINKYTLTIKMRNEGYVDWEDISEADFEEKYYLKITEGPQGLVNQLYPLQQSVPGTRISNNPEERTTTFVLPEQITPEFPDADPGVAFAWQLLRKITDGSLVRESVIPVDGSSSRKCSYMLKIEKLDSQCIIQGQERQPWVFRNEYLPITSGHWASKPSQEILPGENYVVRIGLQNKGTTTWTDGEYILEGKINGELINVPLGSGVSNAQIPAERNTGKTVRGEPDGSGQGSNTYIEYRGTAPDNPTILNTEWQMKIGDRKFGEVCRRDIIIAPERNDAECEKINNEDVRLWTDATKRILNMQVRMKNTGNTLWKQEKYKAVIPGQEDAALTLGTNEINLNYRNPGTNANPKILPTEVFEIMNTINLNDFLQSIAFGTYNVAWKMKDVNGEFGQTCKKEVRIKPRFYIPSAQATVIGASEVFIRAGSESGGSP